MRLVRVLYPRPWCVCRVWWRGKITPRLATKMTVMGSNITLIFWVFSFCLLSLFEFFFFLCISFFFVCFPFFLLRAGWRLLFMHPLFTCIFFLVCLLLTWSFSQNFFLPFFVFCFYCFSFLLVVVFFIRILESRNTLINYYICFYLYYFLTLYLMYFYRVPCFLTQRWVLLSCLLFDVSFLFFFFLFFFSLLFYLVV